MNDSKDHKAAAEPPLDCRVMRGKDEAIDRLRGQLQNCVNLLHRLKRHGYASDVLVADEAIESANRVLYETLGA
jgi:hypothetical protein